MVTGPDRHARTRATVASWRPPTDRGRQARQDFLDHFDGLDRPFDEDADPVHVTSSAIVLDGRGRTVLHRHKRLGLWLQPGGHVDPGEAPEDGALREALEETGLPVRHPVDGPTLVDVDVHDGGRGHLHLDLRWVLLAPADVDFRPEQGESTALRWIPVDEVETWGDASVSEAVRAADALLGRGTADQA